MTLVRIASPDDPRVAHYRLVRDADLRGRHGLFLVESEACIRRWLLAVAARRSGALLPPPVRVHSLLLSAERFESLAELLPYAGDAPIYLASPELIESLSGYEHHQGALGMGLRSDDADAAALCDAVCRAIPPVAGATLLIAEGVAHVDNMGSLFRNAAAFAASGILLGPGCADPLTRKSVRISMGRVFSVPWAVSAAWPEDLALLRRGGFRIIAAENLPEAVELKNLAPAPRNAILLGAEGEGISRRAISLCDVVCRIPTVADISLNVAVASAIFLHEVCRPDR